MKKLLLIFTLITCYSYTTQQENSAPLQDLITTELCAIAREIYGKCIRNHYYKKNLNAKTALQCDQELHNFIAALTQDENTK